MAPQNFSRGFASVVTTMVPGRKGLAASTAFSMLRLSLAEGQIATGEGLRARCAAGVEGPFAAFRMTSCESRGTAASPLRLGLGWESRQYTGRYRLVVEMHVRVSGRSVRDPSTAFGWRLTLLRKTEVRVGRRDERDCRFWRSITVLLPVG
jgi:hypothetical protein